MSGQDEEEFVKAIGLAAHDAGGSMAVHTVPGSGEQQRPGVASPGGSVDGPDFLHDRCRRTRRGAGTLDRVLRGIRLLGEHRVPFFALTVLTAESLAYPDELFDFYRANGIGRSPVRDSPTSCTPGRSAASRRATSTIVRPVPTSRTSSLTSIRPRTTSLK